MCVGMEKIEHAARRRRFRLATVGVLLGLVVSGCFELDFGSDFGSSFFSDDDSEAISRGCNPGTTGKYGRLSFQFEHNNLGSLSFNETSSFAAGTTTRFGVKHLLSEELPGLSVASSDPDVFAVATDDATERPHVVEFLQEGEAGLRMVRDDDGTVYDEVDLKVREPWGLTVVVDHLDTPLSHVGNQFESPDRVVLAPWSGCRLYLHLVDSGGGELYGSYTEQVSPTTLVSYREGESRTYDLIGLSGLSRQIEATGDGTEILLLTGPQAVEASMEIEVTSSPDLERLAVTVGLPFGEVMVVGAVATAFAVGVTPEGDPAFGYRMVWASDDPEVAVIVWGTGEPDSAAVELRAPGTTTLSARWLGDAAVVGQVEITVERD
jgi:hypothetical protein